MIDAIQFQRTRHDDAISVAVGHVLWAQREGQSPAGVIGSFRGTIGDGNTWDDAVFFLARQWLQLDIWAA